jgi:hypothetical protein
MGGGTGGDPVAHRVLPTPPVPGGTPVEAPVAYFTVAV